MRFCEVYDIKFRILNILQQRKRQVQAAALARSATHEFNPADMDHDGAAYYAKVLFELLLGDFFF